MDAFVNVSRKSGKPPRSGGYHSVVVNKDKRLPWGSRLRFLGPLLNPKISSSRSVNGSEGAQKRVDFSDYELRRSGVQSLGQAKIASALFIL